MVLARLLSFALGLVFAWAALGKVSAPRRWRRALTGYRLPPWLERGAAVAVPLVEAGAATAFFLGSTRIAAAGVLVLIAVFSWTILRASVLRGGSRLPCGCFGSDKERDYRTMLARNTVLATGAGALLLYGRDVPGYPSLPTGDAWLPALLVVVGVVLALWLAAGVRSGFRRNVA